MVVDDGFWFVVGFLVVVDSDLWWVCWGFEFFFFFFFRLCGRWLFKVVVVVGLIWGGFEMEVVMGFDLGWICSEVVVGYEVVIFLNLVFIDVGLVGFCCWWWSRGFVARGGCWV